MSTNIFSLNRSNVIFLIVVIILMAYFAIKLIEIFVPLIAKRLSSKRRISLLYFVPVFRLIIVIIMIIAIAGLYINTSGQNFIAFIGALGLALGFVFKDYLSNLFAGIIILYEMPFRLGDWITVNGVYGEITNIGLRVLELHTSDDNIVKIPMSTFWTEYLYNSSSGQKNLMCVVDFYIDPTSQPSIVLGLIRDAAITSTYYDHKKGHSIIMKEFPGYTQYSLKAYPIDSATQFKFQTELIIRVKELFLVEGIKYTQWIGSKE